MYKYILLIFSFSLVACGGSSGSSNNTVTNPSSVQISSQSVSSTARQLALVPLPGLVIEQNGVLDVGTEISLSTDINAQTANQAFIHLLSSLDISSVSFAVTKVRLSLVNQPDLGNEGYRLVIADDINISAQTDTGLFYAVQTLKQLLPVDKQASYKLPRVDITDVPQYAWRGSMVDVARHFFGIEYLKKHIERMAAFKLNKLHLHLSDDQGWRMEIKKYPKLTSVGGSTQAGGGPGGFYTQDELKDLVAFAAQHNIEIIPELDMPGHVQAAIASYNELACDNVTNLGLYIGLDVGFSALCLTKPEVIYPFVKDVLTEVVSVFPSQYIHIGGDEIKHALYPEFIDKTGQIVKDLNRTMVGWEEASAGKNLSSDTLLQLWNDNYDIQSATDRNIHLILSPCSYFYLDHGNYSGQPETYTWCRGQGIPLERVYSFNPQKYSLVTGIEAPVWSEVVTSEAALDNRIWPRLAAVAEIAWSNQSARNYQEFTQRMKALKPYFDKAGIQYYAEPQLGW
jgi:hexosaminidase